MADRESHDVGRKLDRTGRRRFSSLISGKPWHLLLAGALLGGGGAAVLAGLGILPVRLGGPHGEPMPGVRWLLVPIGLVFACLGPVMGYGALRSMSYQNRAARLKRKHPDKPWLADYNWHRKAARDDQSLWRGTGRVIGVLCVGLAILLPATYACIVHPYLTAGGFGALGLPLAVIVAFFDVIYLCMLAYGIYQLVRHHKYGRAMLRFARFPFFLGQTLNARFQPARAIHAEALTFTLRCIEERREPGRGGEAARWVCYERWSQTQEVAHGAALTAADEVPIVFTLPDTPGDRTRLTDREPDAPAVFWELTVQAATPGENYEASFLVPVYAMPRGERAV